MGQAAVLVVYKEDTDIVGAVGLQGPGCGIGNVAHLLGGLPDAGPGFGANVRLVVQRLADRGDGDTAALGNIFHGDHVGASFRRFSLIVIVMTAYRRFSKIARGIFLIFDGFVKFEWFVQKVSENLGTLTT